jgi:hypothetical protein
VTVATPPDLFAPPLFAPLLIPALPSLNLSESERALIGWLQTRAMLQRQRMETARAYYRGLQRIGSLGIAIPPSWQQLRTIVGWPAKAVDPYADRLYVDGFRLANATDSDMALRQIWVANGMDGEQSLAFTDALSMGRAYITSAPRRAGDSPLMCVESPLNMAVSWDSGTPSPRPRCRRTGPDEQRTPPSTCRPDDPPRHRRQGPVGDHDRDVHNFGWVPVIRLANRPRSNNRDGARRSARRSCP